MEAKISKADFTEALKNASIGEAKLEVMNLGTRGGVTIIRVDGDQLTKVAGPMMRREAYAWLQGCEWGAKGA